MVNLRGRLPRPDGRHRREFEICLCPGLPGGTQKVGSAMTDASDRVGDFETRKSSEDFTSFKFDNPGCPNAAASSFLPKCMLIFRVSDKARVYHVP